MLNKIRRNIIFALVAMLVTPQVTAMNNQLSSKVQNIIAIAFTVFSLYCQIQNMKLQYEQQKMISGNIPLKIIESKMNFEGLNREVHSAIKSLVLYYKFPEKFIQNPSEEKTLFFLRFFKIFKSFCASWWNGTSKYTKPFNGIMLYGEPGCGKTELVRAIAGEGVPVFGFSGSEIRQPYVGASEALLRNIYNGANAYRYGGWIRWLLNKPLHPFSVVFLDEIDSVGGERDNSSGHHNISVINQLLTLLDGSTKYENIISIIATNRKDMLDSALVRTGRIDVKIEVVNPTNKEKKKIFVDKMGTFGLKRSESFEYILDGSALHDLTTSDCAHLPKLCHTILSTQEMAKSLDIKDINKEEKNIKEDTKIDYSLVGTKVFNEALTWIDKKNQDRHIHCMYN